MDVLSKHYFINKLGIIYQLIHILHQQSLDTSAKWQQHSSLTNVHPNLFWNARFSFRINNQDTCNDVQDCFSRYYKKLNEDWWMVHNNMMHKSQAINHMIMDHINKSLLISTAVFLLQSGGIFREPNTSKECMMKPMQVI